MSLLLLFAGCLPSKDGAACGPGTHLDSGLCVVDAGDTGSAGGEGEGEGSGDSGAGDSSDSGADTGADSGGDSGADSGGDSGGDSAVDSSGDSGGDVEVDTGACAPPDTWTGPVSAALYTSTPFAATYDAGMATLLTRIRGYGSGSFDEAVIVSGATVVAIAADSRYEDDKWYYVADGYATVPVETSGTAEIGDKVTFADNQYEGMSGVPLVEDPGSWTVESTGNPVSVPHVGATTVDYTTHYSQLVHEAGEIVEPSSVNCGTSYTCFVFEHDGVRDRIRVPALNDFGLDVDYDGGLCAEVVAPTGIYEDSDGVQGYFIDIGDSTWMRVWAKP